MNTTQLIGETSFTEQPSETGFQSGRGWFVTRKWTGARSKLVDFVFNRLPRLYSDLRLEEEGEKATVIATYGIAGPNDPDHVTDPISVVWTMPNNENDLSLYELPEVEDLFLALEDTDAAKLAAIMEEGISAHTPFDDLDWPTFFSTDEQAIIKKLYSRLMRRIEVFRASQYVLRKVQTVIAESQIKVAHENVNRIFTHDQLTTAEPTLPAATLIDAAGLSKYFWLKKTPTVEAVSRGQFQINQEYWGTEKYDPFIYKPAK